MCGGRPSIATEHASADSPAGKMVAAGRHRRLQLPPGGDKQLDTDRVPIPRDQSLPAHATAAEPERLDDLGADQAVGRRLAPATANPSSVAREALRRQTPKGGAVCPNWARTDLCGGREVTRVPTAIKDNQRCDSYGWCLQAVAEWKNTSTCWVPYDGLVD